MTTTDLVAYDSRRATGRMLDEDGSARLRQREFGDVRWSVGLEAVPGGPAD